MIGNLFEEKYQSITWTMEIEKIFPSWKPKDVLLTELKECRQKYSSVQCEDHFGAENLKNLPFRHLKVLLSYSDRDGDEYLEIDFNTFKNDHYCMVAGMGEPLLTDSMVKAIEKELFKILNV